MRKALISVMISQEALDNLRITRMWHWEQVIVYRDKANRLKQIVLDMSAEELGKLKSAKRILTDVDKYDRRANAHMRSVQALNDILPGTAEQDVANKWRPNGTSTSS